VSRGGRLDHMTSCCGGTARCLDRTRWTGSLSSLPQDHHDGTQEEAVDPRGGRRRRQGSLLHLRQSQWSERSRCQGKGMNDPQLPPKTNLPVEVLT
jgi:hypothetical protein